ncbi:hypothetical protein Hanom_Chr03g00215841 [Helianthus anomalus]
MRARKPWSRHNISEPSMKKCALGDNFMVELRARIEGQIHPLTSESTHQILYYMKLKKIVQHHEKNRNHPHHIVCDWYERQSS